MKRGRWFIVIIFVLIFPLLTGCWDRLEIEDRSTILGLAIDPLNDDKEGQNQDQGGDSEQNEDEGEGKDKSQSSDFGITGPHARGDVAGYRLTAQLAIPGRIPLGPGGGTSAAPQGRPVWVVSAKGRTIDDAVNNLQHELADKLFLGHLRVIIINQKLAQSAGVHDIQDFFRRNGEIRRLAWMVISEGSASEAMEAAPKLERVPTLYLVGTMDHAVDFGQLPDVFLGNYWSTLSSKGQEPVLPLIKVVGDKVELEGLCVFRAEQMVGKLDQLETAAFMELTGEKQAGYGVAVRVPGDPKHSIIVKGTSRKSTTKIRMENGKPAFDVYTIVEVNIEEKTGRRQIDTLYPQIAAEVTQNLTTGQERLIQKLQKLHADVFGLGEFIRGRAPDFWKDNLQESREKWEEQFSKTPIRVHVRVIVRRSGMAAH